MRVALDVTAAIAGTTGVSRYARELHRELGVAGVDVAAFAVGRGTYPLPEGARHVAVPLRVVHQSWQRLGLPRAEHLVGPVDLSHCLDLVPAPSKAPRVMTAQDLLAVRHPDLHSARQVQQQMHQLAAMRTADLVLAISEATAEDCVAQGVPAEHVEVTLLGASEPPPGVVPHPGKYLLAVGELTPRKNLTTLISAFRAARLPEEVELLLVGPDGYAAQSVAAQVGGRVQALGRVDDEQLASLYAGAIAFCFPTIAEGFGLPVLEAMQHGTPVLASDLPVLHEVAHDAAHYVAALDVVAWSRALEDIVSDGDRRREMATRGRAVAAGRTWAVTAAATLAAYKAVLA